jgi:hypothetical protein
VLAVKFLSIPSAQCPSPRRPMRPLFLALIAGLPSLAGGQGRLPVASSDYGKWETPGASALSPDGRWLAYGVITLAMAAAPQFASTSRWLAYSIAVTPEERLKLEKDKKPVRTSAGLVELATGGTHVLAQASSYRFSPDGRFLAVRTVAADPAKRDAADLLLRDLAAGTTQTFGNISAYAWADSGALLALILETEGNAGNGVQLLNANTGRLTTLTSSTDRYRGLAWRRRATDLAVLRSQATPGFKDSTHIVLAWKNPQSTTPVVAACPGMVERRSRTICRIARPHSWRTSRFERRRIN